MKRTEKNKELYKKLEPNMELLKKVEFTFEKLSQFRNTPSKEESDEIWYEYYNSWDRSEDDVRQFASACFWINEDADPKDVLIAFEIIKESKNAK